MLLQSFCRVSFTPLVTIFLTCTVFFNHYVSDLKLYTCLFLLSVYSLFIEVIIILIIHRLKNVFSIISWLNPWRNISTTKCLLCLFPQTLFFKTPVLCRLVGWNGIQEYPDQPQDACRSHAWLRAPSAQHSHQQASVLPLPVIFQWQPAQCDLTMIPPYECASLLYREQRELQQDFTCSVKKHSKKLY